MRRYFHEALIDRLGSIDGLNDQMRKLYNTYAPDRNPFGTDDMPHLFDDLDCRTKVRLLTHMRSINLLPNLHCRFASYSS